MRWEDDRPTGYDETEQDPSERESLVGPEIRDDQEREGDYDPS